MVISLVAGPSADKGIRTKLEKLQQYRSNGGLVKGDMVSIETVEERSGNDEENRSGGRKEREEG